MSAIPQLLLLLTTITRAMTGTTDLCDVVNPTTEIPTICEAALEGAPPTLDEDVCCVGSSCTVTSSTCQRGESLYHCQLGTVDPTGAVTCFFEVPDYCLVFTCDSMVSPPALEEPICCEAGTCWPGDSDCEGDLYWCLSGVSNVDGTVTCLDEA